MNEKMAVAVEAAQERVGDGRRPNREPDAIHDISQSSGPDTEAVIALAAENVEHINLVSMPGALYAEIWHTKEIPTATITEQLEPTTFRERYIIPAVSNFKYAEPTVAEDDEYLQRVHIFSLMGEAWCHRTADRQLNKDAMDQYPGMNMTEAAALTDDKLCSECLREAEVNAEEQGHG